MPEQNPSNLEQEIAELSEKIAAKKKELAESGQQEIEGKQAVAETVAEHFNFSAPQTSATPTPAAPLPAATPTAQTTAHTTKDYLETLPAETVSVVNAYVNSLPEEGIRKTITKVQNEHPYILDAFHDVLVTHLYEELKARGLIK